MPENVNVCVSPRRRLVPLRGRDQKSESEGLKHGELAWILGKSHSSQTTEYNPTWKGGYGVDRMQRMAATSWVEEWFNQTFGAKSDVKIDLLNLTFEGGEMKEFENYLHGATGTDVPDIAYFRKDVEDVALAKGFEFVLQGENGNNRQGINVATTSPFLKGFEDDVSLVRFGTLGTGMKSLDLARNTGDDVAFMCLERALREKDIMKWIPDGIVLSKLENPSGDKLTSEELDARQAQLFNIGIQGPAITTSWTSDVRDYKLQVTPLDKVFICVVAVLQYGTANVSNADRELSTATRQLFDAIKAKKTEREIKELAQLVKDKKKSRSDTDADVDLDRFNLNITDNEVQNIEDISDALRNQTKTVTSAKLSNFRLMRTTSSHMTNYSFYRSNDPNSRLGLKLRNGLAEVIVGGWCIGSVLDSAASRSVTNGAIKSHPTSRSINVNVNVEWWSSNRLHKHYMNEDGALNARGEMKVRGNNKRNVDQMQSGTALLSNRDSTRAEPPE